MVFVSNKFHQKFVKKLNYHDHFRWSLTREMGSTMKISRLSICPYKRNVITIISYFLSIRFLVSNEDSCDNELHNPFHREKESQSLKNILYFVSN